MFRVGWQVCARNPFALRSFPSSSIFISQWRGKKNSAKNDQGNVEDTNDPTGSGLSNQEEKKLRKSKDKKTALTEEERKLHQAIMDMKELTGTIVKRPKQGKYVIEYPKLTDQQLQLTNFLRGEANKQLGEVDEYLEMLEEPPEAKRTFWESIQYWLSSAELVCFVMLCMGWYSIFSYTRYSLDRYFLQFESIRLDEIYEEKINQLERKILQINKQNLDEGRNNTVIKELVS